MTNCSQGELLLSWFSWLTQIFPTLVASILVWIDLDKRIVTLFLDSISPMRCKTGNLRRLCINELTEVLDMFTVTSGLCVTLLVSAWLVAISDARIPLSISAVISPIFFVVYLHGPPSRYERTMNYHLSDILALLYLLLSAGLAFCLTAQV